MRDETAAPNEEQEPEAESAYTKVEQAHYQQIREMNEEVGKLESVHLGKKEAAAAAKKRYEAAAEELHGFIGHGPELQQQLPGMDDADRADPWRDLPLSELGLGASLEADLVADLDLGTIGELSNMLAADDQWWHEVKGVGPAAGDMVAEAFVAFWETHPGYCEPVDEPEPANPS